MNKKTQIIVGVGAAILAAVAIFVCFANCFQSGDGSYPSSSCFNIMFAPHNINRASGSLKAPYAVPGLIVAFALQCLSILICFAGMALRGKAASLAFGLVTLALVASGIIWLCAVPLYTAVNPITPGYNPNIVLGAGSICSVIFAFAGAALSALGAYRCLKA